MTAGKGRKKSVEFVIPNEPDSIGQETVTSEPKAKVETKTKTSKKSKIKWIVIRPSGQSRANAFGQRVQNANEVGGENGGILLDNMEKAKQIGTDLGWKYQIYDGPGSIIKPGPKTAFTDVINWDTIEYGELQVKIIEFRESGILEEDDVSLSASREEMVSVLKQKTRNTIQVPKVP